MPWGWSGDGNWAGSPVRMVPLIGVRVCRCRPERVEWPMGMLLTLTGSGPRKMAFSVLAQTQATKSDNRVERRCAGGAMSANGGL